MKYFIISDVHGHYDEMIEGLNEVGYDSENADHHLVIAGDLFDRGTQNTKVLDYVHDLLVNNKVTLIKGNHDEFFYEYQDLIWNYQNNGFYTTIDEFLGDIEARTLTPYELLQKVFELHPKLEKVLKAMVNSFKINNHIITHAGLDASGIPDPWNKPERWIKLGRNDNDGNIYIFGHRHMEYLNKQFSQPTSTKPFVYKNYIGIDNAVFVTKKMFVYIIQEEN